MLIDYKEDNSTTTQFIRVLARVLVVGGITYLFDGTVLSYAFTLTLLTLLSPFLDKIIWR